MRNLKKLLAVVVAICCVFATFTVPAFAETKTPSAIAEELGVIKGTGDGVTAEYLATQPDRLQGAIMFLRLKGLEDDAIAFTGTDNFADVAGLNATNKAILAYLKAHPELGFGGIGGNKFGATLKMEAKQYYKVMLNALGYTYGTDDTADFTWNTVFSFAASKGLYKLADVTKFTVNDLCVGTVEALKATVKGGTDTLIAKLVIDGNVAADKAASTGLFVASEVALAVTGATADNLIVAKIVFNKDLNKDTVNTTNISASGLASVTLGDDNRTVYAKLTSAVSAQDTAVDFTIKNVKDTTGATIKEVKKSVTFKDVTPPSVTGVTVKNAKTIVIAASEPLNYVKTTYQPLNSIKIDGAVAFGQTSVDYVKNTLTVSLYTALANGTHKFDIADLTDYAGYKAVAQSFNGEVVADTAAPVLVSAKMLTLNKIEVTFDEDLSAVGTFKVGTSSVASATPSQGTDKSKVTLTLSTPLDIGAVVQVMVYYVGQKDVVGNEVKTEVNTFKFTVSDDTTLPTATATIAEGNKITVTFSKPMYATGSIKVLKASDGTQITSKTITADSDFKTDSNNTIIELGAIAGQDPIDVKVNITGMKDSTVRTNVLAEQNIALKFFDTKLPEVGAKYKVTSDASTPVDHTKDYVTFYFNEAMNVDTIKALSNYVIQGAATTNGALSAFTDVSVKEVASDAKSVSIYLPGVASSGKYAGATFNVYAVKDVAGNMQPQTLGVTAASLSPLTTSGSAIATGKRVIKVEFNEKIGSIDYTAFEVRDGSNNVVAYGGTGSLATPTQAAIDLYNDLPAGTSALKVIFNNNSANIKDIYGTALSTTDAGFLTDKIKPTITVDKPTTAGAITISFDEIVAGAANAGTTTIGALSTKLVLVKDSSTVTTPATVKFLDAAGVVTGAGIDFKSILIEGLESGVTYTVVIYDNAFVDKAGTPNGTAFVNTTVKTN